MQNTPDQSAKGGALYPDDLCSTIEEDSRDKLTLQDKFDIISYDRKVKDLKAVYSKRYKASLERDRSMKGCWVIVYKNRLWCRNDRFSLAIQALYAFQERISDTITEPFYMTRVGYPDSCGTSAISEEYASILASFENDV